MNRKWIYVFGFLFVVLAAMQFTVFAQQDSSNKPTVIRASRFELTDEEGNVILTLGGTSPKSGFATALVQFGDVTRPVFSLQRFGDSRVTFCASTAKGTLFRIALADNEGSQISWSNEDDKYSMSMGLLAKDIPSWNLKSGTKVKDLGALKN